MEAPEKTAPSKRWRGFRRPWFWLAILLMAGLVVFALSRLELHRVGHAIATASPGWLVVALAAMAFSLVMRAVSWHNALRAALPDKRIPWLPVIRATMIGVMGSAVFPGRIGEPTRIVVISRRLEGSTRALLPVVAGTVFSQTIMNLLALGILAAVTFSSVSLFQGNGAGLLTALVIPLLVVLLVVAGPRLLALARRSRSRRVASAAELVQRLLRDARQGLIVFARPRFGIAAVAAQLFAWALQWQSCYAVLLALHLQGHTDLVTAAAILLAVNLSAVLPATPSNVGVFQAACIVVLAAYGVNAGTGLAYGLLLQAVEVVTALLLGIPALLGEGLSWDDLRVSAEESLPGERPK
jgi:phosphatidyl-myo-inositol alpha-mannosyltransferase